MRAEFYSILRADACSIFYLISLGISCFLGVVVDLDYESTGVVKSDSDEILLIGTSSLLDFV